MQIDPNLFDFIKLLNIHSVEYLIVGGYALGFHGHPRYTGDLDVWIKISEENADKMMAVAREYPIPTGIFKRGDFLDERPMAGLHFGKSPLRIDLLNSISGVSFQECYLNASYTMIQNVNIPFISIDDFIKNKTASGRLKDMADIDELKRNKKD